MFIEHITKAGERWDTIAYSYYGDAMSYDRIIAANPQVAITPVLPSGIVLAIPVIEQSDVNSVEDTPPWLR